MNRLLLIACLGVALVASVNAAHAQVGKSVTITDANTIGEADLAKLPGMTPASAKAVVAKRPFLSVAALAVFHREIDKYVDDTELARLEQYVFVPIDLNTASDADILTIPGMGQRMLREFKEYRPYDGIERFRREIGKYVSKEEVARLERYVTVGKK
jgi:DNA uptake protein ComE-like DNA-binding protein